MKRFTAPNIHGKTTEIVTGLVGSEAMRFSRRLLGNRSFDL